MTKNFIAQGSDEWNERVISMAMESLQIHPCADCGAPCERGYICGRCGCREPDANERD